VYDRKDPDDLVPEKQQQVEQAGQPEVTVITGRDHRKAQQFNSHDAPLL
jgi:hypothetical protein